MIVLSPVASHSCSSRTISSILVLGTISWFPRDHVFMVAAETPLLPISLVFLLGDGLDFGGDFRFLCDLFRVMGELIASSSEVGWCYKTAH